MFLMTMISFISKLFNKKNPSSKSSKILVIEDSPVDMGVVLVAIAKGGYAPLTATYGQEGVNIACKELPDLIILDYNLPDQNGLEVCDQLKANPLTRNIPVIFLTCVDTPESVIDCYDKGGEYYLSKPISPRVLLKYIDQTLAQSRKEQKT